MYSRAQISPDGTKIAVGIGGPGKITVVPIQGGVPDVLCPEGCNSILGWSADSRKILTWKGKPIADFLLDISDGKLTPVLSHPQWDLHRPRFSPDGQWLAVNPKMGERQSALYIVPYRNGVSAAQSEWIPVTDGHGIDGQPEWSPDGNILYFHSQRLGFIDQWAVRLNPATKHPEGEPFLVQAFHTARQAVFSALGYAVIKDRIIWSLPERTGNIYVMENESSAGR